MDIIVLKKETATWVQILDKAVCILHSSDNIGKGTNSSIISPAMSKIEGQTGLLSLGVAIYFGEEKLRI